MDRKFAYFFITGDASVQLPSDSLSGTNFKLSSDNLYGTEGVYVLYKDIYRLLLSLSYNPMHSKNLRQLKEILK